MKRCVPLLCALSLVVPQCAYADVLVHRTEGKPEIIIKVNNEGSDDSKIVFNVEVSGTNDRDIQEIVKLISAFMQKLDGSPNPLVATQSWASRNPILLAVLAAGITAAAGGAYLWMKN